jgi:hypothetical protein
LKDFNLSDLSHGDSLQQQLAECAKAIGGNNYFLQLLEAIREAQPHPIINNNCEFRYALGNIKWSKPIFRDKLTLLKEGMKINKNGNIFPKEGIKGYKSILNLLRTLKPITFNVQPKNKKDGPGFTIQPFDIIDEKTTFINPLFEAVFFSPVYQVKKILNAK